MARSYREKFEDERDRVAEIDDPDVADALRDFADALDPDFGYEQPPKPNPTGGIDHETPSNGTAAIYLQKLRLAHDRGLDLLEAGADEVNRFMVDMTTEPDRRRGELDYAGTISKPTGTTYQCALRAFYRWATEPTSADDRPDVDVDWPADGIMIFRERSDPKHDEDDMAEPSDVEAMREACLRSHNTRRDRAFIELVAGTCQRVYALVTLRVKHVHLDAEVPHVLLNPEIDGDGDKGAIENTGRWKPIVSDTEPIRQWIEHHSLRDPEVRAEHGAPEDIEDCYLFVGDPAQSDSDLSDHWSASGARDMLERRKADTADLSTVDTVEIPVNPHNWRHYAYTMSQDLPIDESKRRKVFGWVPGSDTGSQTYGHKTNQDAGKEFASAWAEAFEEASVSTQEMIGEVAAADDLPAETRQALVEAITEDDDLLSELAEHVAAISGD